MFSFCSILTPVSTCPPRPPQGLDCERCGDWLLQKNGMSRVFNVQPLECKLPNHLCFFPCDEHVLCADAFWSPNTPVVPVLLPSLFPLSDTFRSCGRSSQSVGGLLQGERTSPLSFCVVSLQWTTLWRRRPTWGTAGREVGSVSHPWVRAPRNVCLTDIRDRMVSIMLN